MTKAELTKLQIAVAKTWSRATAKQWTTANPAAGQCNVTSIVVQEIAGGEILKTPLAGGYHFYNLIDGQSYDFTAAQFDAPIRYDDIRSTRDEALAGVSDDEYRATRAGMLLHLGKPRTVRS